MSRFTAAQFFGFLGFLAIVGTWIIVAQAFGQREAFRFWGIALVLVSMVFTVARRIPVTVGERKLKPLEGWRKSFVLVPSYFIGLAVAFFPHEVACGVNLKGYICDAA